MPRFPIRIILVLFLYSLNPNRAQQEDDENVCSLCQDGSPITKPDGLIELDEEEWKCSDLSQILWLLGVEAGGERCNALHFRGFLQCGCPTFVNENVCALCPQGFSDLPDPNITIPGFDDLTCGDIVFVQRDDAEAPVACDDLKRYSQLCQCPETCSFCRYSDENPVHLDRIIPYLTEGDNQVTCAELAVETDELLLGERCDAFREPPVQVNVEGYCGCPRSSPANLCSLCPDGAPLRDQNLVIPNVGGLTCLELQEYLQYVTDLDSCLAISERSQACCGYFDPCPICEGGAYNSYGLGSGKVYEPYNLGCDLVGQATHFGFPELTCEEAQERFPYFCRCEGVKAACTICPLNQVPPEPSRFIPLLNITCGEANDFVSTSTTATECAETLASFKIDVAGFCGCGQDASLFGRCAFCPEGQELRYPITMEDITHSNIFGAPIVPDSTNTQTQQSIFVSPDFVGNSTTTLPSQDIFGSFVVPDSTANREQHCRDREVMAPYAIEEEFCKTVQQSVPECCRPQSTLAPTVSSQPTTKPSAFPTFPPTMNGTNASFWWNFTGDSNRTNETVAPTAPTAPTPPEEESSARGLETYQITVGLILLSVSFSMMA